MAPWYIEKSQPVPSQKEKEAEINFYTNLLATSDWPVCMHIALTVVASLNISFAQECQRKYG